jgi:type IV pilus assembly protein PilO
MGLLPQDQRSQKLIAIGLIAVGLAAAYQQLVWTPKNVELHALSVRLDALDSLNRVAKAEVAKGSATKMKQEAEGYARQLTILRRLVPTQNEVPALLESVASAARRAGLDLSDVQPDGVVNGDQFDTYRYKMGVTGPYEKVGAFLANVGSLPRIIAPINVSMMPAARIGEMKPKKGEQFLDVKFQIQTYVAHSALELATPSAKPGAP